MERGILLISTCNEKFHELEFVRPIESILKKEGKACFIKNYKKLTSKDLETADKVTICGTSLKDNEFLKNIDKFSWIKYFNKPLLGICAGMQIISMVFGSKVMKKTEIGFYTEEFNKSFLGLKDSQEVYHLHNNCCSLPRDFEEYTKSKIPQAIKHKQKEIYGVLFHPEVRQKELILSFLSL